MSVAYVDEIPYEALTVTDYLGPARVVEMAGLTPIVALVDDRGRERRGRAELALTFPYEPSAGDELLVIGKGERLYAIGLISGQGQVALRFQGNVKLQAVGGVLELEGDEGVRLRGQSVEVVTRTLKTYADSISERANHVYRRVKGTLDEHMGNRRELVDGELSTRADTIHTATAGIVTINGKEIHLG